MIIGGTHPFPNPFVETTDVAPPTATRPPAGRGFGTEIGAVCLNTVSHRRVYCGYTPQGL